MKKNEPRNKIMNGVLSKCMMYVGQRADQSTQNTYDKMREMKRNEPVIILSAAYCRNISE